MANLWYGQRAGGFTLVEIMLVLAAIAAILTIGIPTYSEHRKRVMIAEVKKDLVVISQKLEKYQSFNYEYPEYLVDVGVSLRDPWGNDYQYLNLDDVDPDTGDVTPGAKGPKPDPRTKAGLEPLNTDYDLFSMGEDGDYAPKITEAASLDDIIRADNGAYLDNAANY
jgi:general secretion pathway protein G